LSNKTMPYSAYSPYAKPSCTPHDSGEQPPTASLPPSPTNSPAVSPGARPTSRPTSTRRSVPSVSKTSHTTRSALRSNAASQAVKNVASPSLVPSSLGRACSSSTNLRLGWTVGRHMKSWRPVSPGRCWVFFWGLIDWFWR
jgi:hypothetical protein